MTFKELSIGQIFRQANHMKDVEWVKVSPTTNERTRYNAVSTDGQRTAQVGHSAKVVIPPYGDTTQANRQKRRYDQLKAIVTAAGWDSIAALETAYIRGEVEVPRKAA